MKQTHANVQRKQTMPIVKQSLINEWFFKIPGVSQVILQYNKQDDYTIFNNNTTRTISEIKNMVREEILKTDDGNNVRVVKTLVYTIENPLWVTSKGFSC